MEVFSLPAAASAIAANVPKLTRLVIDNLQDQRLLDDPSLESTIEGVLDRLCLSLQLAKPVGLATWAAREGRRLGVYRASELVNAAAHALAVEAESFEIDHGRLLAFLEVLKGEAAATLSALDEQREETGAVHSETALALLSMLAERDTQTCCHSKATGEWARRLCGALVLPPEQTTFIVLCAVLHDIGKISTPDAILFKPTALTESEWEIMRDHSAAGQRILDQISSLARCSPIVRAHHERWDGKGYPDGLSADAIPFEARVVAVADAFHAMISNRPYRKAIAPRQALETLETGRGTQWDPMIVDAMLSLFSTRRRQASSTGASSA